MLSNAIIKTLEDIRKRLQDIGKRAKGDPRFAEQFKNMGDNTSGTHTLSRWW